MVSWQDQARDVSARRLRGRSVNPGPTVFQHAVVIENCFVATQTEFHEPGTWNVPSLEPADVANSAKVTFRCVVLIGRR